MADQARREDSEYWSGPTYAHGTTDRGGLGRQRDWEQKDTTDSREHRRQQRAARKEARREARGEAEGSRRDVSPPPPQYPFDQWREYFQAWGEGYKEQEEDWEKAWGERYKEKEEDWEKAGDWSDWSEKAQRKYHENFSRAKKERSDRRKAEKERKEKKWAAELLFLLSKIINIQVDIERMGDKVDETKSATTVRCSCVAPC